MVETVGIVPVLRAGLGLTNSFINMLPNARVLHLGIFRDEVIRAQKPYLYVSFLLLVHSEAR